MKKFLFAVMLFAAMTFTQSANAQIKLGVKGGLDITKFSLNKDIFDVNNRTGWFIGPTIKFTLPVVGLSMDISGLYDQRSSNVQMIGGSTEVTTLKNKTIQVPVNLRLGAGIGSTANVFIFAGPQFGFNVGDRDFTYIKDNVANIFQLNKSTLSVNVGAGATLNSHLQVTAEYNISVGDTSDATVINVLNTTVDNKKKKKYNGHANSWQIALAYFF